VPVFAEYYVRNSLWPAASLARRQAILHLIEAHRAAQRGEAPIRVAPP
jgi:hypothetical protein